MQFITTAFFVIVSSVASATPAMNVYTINTADHEGYHNWARSSGPIIGESVGADVVGVCTPHAGAFDDRDLYVYMLADSMATGLQALPGNAIVKAEVAKLESVRKVRAREIFSVVKEQTSLVLNVGERHALGNTLVKARDVGAYVRALGVMEKVFHKNGFEDIGFQAFLGHSGDTTGVVIASMVAPTAKRLGEAYDAVGEYWARNAFKAVKSKRKRIRGFFGSCETVYVR